MRARQLAGVRRTFTDLPQIHRRTGLSQPDWLGSGIRQERRACGLIGGILGFGFIEVGGITPLPQDGNPSPRLFRLPEAEALINRMGFNNCGAQRAAENLGGRKWTGVLGINLGKNAQTPLVDAAADYCAALEMTYSRGDFFTVNVSSPNTENLRDLQRRAHLRELIEAVAQKRDSLADIHHRRAPLLVKFSPDLSDTANYAERRQWRWNRARTARLRPTQHPPVRRGIGGMQCAMEKGGLSGRPLFSRAVEVIGILRESLAPGRDADWSWGDFFGGGRPRALPGGGRFGASLHRANLSRPGIGRRHPARFFRKRDLNGALSFRPPVPFSANFHPAIEHMKQSP